MEQGNIDAALAASFDFTAEELELNRRGELSERQEQMISAQQRRSGVFTIVAGAAITASVAVIGAILLLSADASGAAVAAFGAVLAIVVLLFATSVLVGRRKSTDLRERRITSVTGLARTRHKRTVSQYGGVDLYKLKIARTKFALANKAQFGAFSDGARYSVHFIKAPGAPLILSASPE